MKRLLVALPLIVLCACASAPQKQDAPAAPAAATATPVLETSNQAAASPTGELHCKFQQDERILKVVPKDAGCELQYTKAGTTETKATAFSGTQHCEDVKARMTKNLETAGFTCK